MMHIATAYLCVAVLANVQPIRAQEMGEPGVNGIPPGWKIIEGDILVPEDFGSNTAAAYMTDFWAGGIVPYEFDSDGDDSVSATQQQIMLNAMAVWTGVATITFRPHELTDAGWLRIRDSTNDDDPSNSSPVGSGVGSRTINIVSWNRWICAHELGHSLGLWHEQSRPNRDDYVRIEIDRVDFWSRHNFDRHSDAKEYPRGGYDFDSIMHYGQCAFSICDDGCMPPCNCAAAPAGCRTITVLPPHNTDWQDDIGQRDHLSHFDGLTMSFIYPRAGWEFVDRSYTGFWENGTLWEPHKTFLRGFEEVPTNGTLWLEPGQYLSEGRWTKPVRIQAPRGGVRLADG